MNTCRRCRLGILFSASCPPPLCLSSRYVAVLLILVPTLLWWRCCCFFCLFLSSPAVLPRFPFKTHTHTHKHTYKPACVRAGECMLLHAVGFSRSARARSLFSFCVFGCACQRLALPEKQQEREMTTLTPAARSLLCTGAATRQCVCECVWLSSPTSVHRTVDFFELVWWRLPGTQMHVGRSEAVQAPPPTRF